MNKWIMRLTALFFFIALLAGCGAGQDTQENTQDNGTTEAPQEEQANNEAEQETATITISKNEGEELIAEDEVTIEEGAILMDVLKENFEVEEEGGFINSIEGEVASEVEKMAWMYFVNDETASVGAAEYEVQPGDQITFDMQPWE